MKTLQLSDVQARKIYSTASQELKTILENNWSKQFFSQDITERIKNFLDVLEVCGETVEQFNHRTQYDTLKQRAGKMIESITQALNQGWEPDWSDSNQQKWIPWFYMNNPSGFRFDGSGSGSAGTYAGGGFRLASKKLSDYAANQFIDVYKTWMQG